MRQPLACTLTDLFSPERPAPLDERDSGPASLGEFSRKLNNPHKPCSQTGFTSWIQEARSGSDLGAVAARAGAAAWIVSVTVSVAVAWIVMVTVSAAAAWIVTVSAGLQPL